MDAALPPYDAGYKAAAHGRMATANPFPIDSPHRLEWENGWQAFYDEDEDEWYQVMEQDEEENM